MTVKVKRLTATAKLPAYAHDGDAGMDVFTDENVTLAPQERRAVKTGVSLEVPVGYVALVWDKSGIALKNGVTTMAGVIDAGYRGEVQIVLYNAGAEVYQITAGQKISQILIQPVVQAILETADDLTDTTRGAGGFGSTGL